MWVLLISCYCVTVMFSGAWQFGHSSITGLIGARCLSGGSLALTYTNPNHKTTANKPTNNLFFKTIPPYNFYLYKMFNSMQVLQYN